MNGKARQRVLRSVLQDEARNPASTAREMRRQLRDAAEPILDFRTAGNDVFRGRSMQIATTRGKLVGGSIGPPFPRSSYLLRSQTDTESGLQATETQGLRRASRERIDRLRAFQHVHGSHSPGVDPSHPLRRNRKAIYRPLLILQR